ncbi:methyltransferase domain-containing protein [Halomarina oriensis]|uniref:Methyltransferase domain-containing protein n=1 Tax=Halomarina oriensis TaxID=671145 RepID=A0A6B0GEB9_9EURY|nr:methyltransferase domain-containing protein [Halomarina oriensis]
MTDWCEDREALAEQYDDASNLDARIALHERFSTAERDLKPWLFDQFDCPDSPRILTLGGGPGDVWADVGVPGDWTVVHTDASSGMVEEARDAVDAQFAVADAASLPFASDSFDAVTANFVLYHIAERRRTFREIRRVLRPGGTLHAATSGEAHLRELYERVEAVHEGVVPRIEGFRLENGREQLTAVFDRVECRRHEDALAVTDVDVLVGYALSREEFDESDAPALREAFEEGFEDGVFRVRKDAGVFVAHVAE